MKPPLPNADELTTRYAVGDLDPTEAELLREAMASDQDLLIEAESQRRTWARVQGLSELSAPAGLLEQTVRLAAAQRRSSPLRIVTFPPAARWAAAACLVAVVGWNLLEPTTGRLGAPAEGTASESVDSPDTAVRQAQIQPWIDRRDVLRVGQMQAMADSVTGLRPIEDTTGFIRMMPGRQLQLTGTKTSP